MLFFLRRKRKKKEGKEEEGEEEEGETLDAGETEQLEEEAAGSHSQENSLLLAAMAELDIPSKEK